MNVSAAAGVATQVAQTKIALAQNFIKSNAEAEKSLVNLLTQSAQAGTQAASSSSRIDIIV